LTEAFHRRFPDLPQVACFDTTFHHDLPRVAQMLPIPRRYEAQGVRRYGSTDCRMRFWSRTRPFGGPEAHKAGHPCHLGNGASLAAVRYGKSVDTSMSFHAGGRGADEHSFRGSRSRLVWYLARTENMSAKQFNEMVNLQSGCSAYPNQFRHARFAQRRSARCAGSGSGRLFATRSEMDWRICSGVGWSGHAVFAGGIERTRPQSGSGFVTGWDSWDRIGRTSETLQTKA